MKALLLQDIVSNGKGKQVYGKKGEIVVITHQHNNVFIVEKIDGLRFSVNEKLIQKI